MADDADGVRATFGQNLRRLRLERELTQSQLARRLGLAGKAQVARWGNGHAAPREMTLRRLATSLTVTMPELLGNVARLRLREPFDLVKTVVEMLLEQRRRENEPAVVRSATSTRITAERVARMVRALTTADALSAVENFVQAQHSREHQHAAEASTRRRARAITAARRKRRREGR